jgi:hypothetical protein
MNVVFDDSVGAQARQWFSDVLASSRIDFNQAISSTITVKMVTEPSAPGHNDYACTSAMSGGWLIELRRGLDDGTSPLVANIPGPTHLFFMETIAHELAHVLIGQSGADPAALCALFVHAGLTGTIRYGTLADWNNDTQPTVTRQKWEDHIEEAVAETVKDAALPDRRVYDNRTNWRVPEANFEALMTALLGGGFTADFSTDPTGTWTSLGDPVEGLVQAGAVYCRRRPVPDEVTTLASWSDIAVGPDGSLPLAVGSVSARGPHPLTVRCSVVYSDTPVTFKIVHNRGGVLDAGGNHVIGGVFTDIVTNITALPGPDVDHGPFDVDIANGDWLHLEGYDTNDARIRVGVLLPWTGGAFIYQVPVTIAAGVSMGYRAVFAPALHEGLVEDVYEQPGPWYSGPRAYLGLRAGSGPISRGALVSDELVLILTGGAPQQTPHEIDFASGGTWLFQAELSADQRTVTATIRSSEGTVYEYAASGPAADVVPLSPVFGGGGTNNYYSNPIATNDSHYDDWYLAIPADAPEWPYVPPFVAASAGASASLRLT